MKQPPKIFLAIPKPHKVPGDFHDAWFMWNRHYSYHFGDTIPEFLSQQTASADGHVYPT